MQVSAQHPITPPPELVKQWQYEANHNEAMFPQVATQAAQWGADQELDACCEWLAYEGYEHEHLALRASRRPKPPSLKEQALATLQRVSKDQYPCNYQDDEDWDTIRRAIEQLPDAL